MEEKEICLYKVETNGLGVFYVIAKSFDDAAEVTINRLTDSDYGYSSSREIKSVELIAKQSFMGYNKQFFSGDNNNLIISES